MRNREAQIGIIGGSGLYAMEGLSDVEFIEMDTPFGKPSDAVVTGVLEGVQVAFLPRHGRGHRFNPSHIPARANIYALKSLGVQRVISISAVGSLQEDISPLELVIPDQLIDRTRQRDGTFYDHGMVVHIGFAEPFCSYSSDVVARCAGEMDLNVHPDGTMVVMEGPAFSTKAESLMYRSWGAHIIGMTALPEAKLAREAEMCYVTMAWVTDYDCWHESEETVTVEMVVGNLIHNVAASKDLLRAVVPLMAGPRDCPCATALKDAIITPKEGVPEDVKRKLAPLAGKYLT